MSQIEGLKMFISERLHAATSEILGAVVKTMSDYEEQACRLKEENQRHRSLLDIIVKSKLSEGGAASHTNTSPRPSSPASSSSSTAVLRPSGPNSQPRVSFNTPTESKGFFTSCEDFLKSQDENGNCPYCIKRLEATEVHLMRRHYLRAIHFIQEGIEKFVIPCMCKERIQGRSHWHCPCCQKIIYRTCNFEAHLSKMHGYVTKQHSRDAGANQPSETEDGALHRPELWTQQEQPGSLMLQVKQETEQVRHLEDTEVDGGTNFTQEPTTSIACMDSLIQDISQIQTVQVNRRLTQPDPLCLREHSPRNSAVAENGGGSNAEELKKRKRGSNVETLNAKSNKCVERSWESLSVQKSTETSSSQSSTGPHCCKVCGKVFHYLYTLKAHVQTHTQDKRQICGKHLRHAESLTQHLQSHAKRNKCRKCGKQFSSSFRLKRHMKFHQPNVLKVMLSA